MSTPGIAPQPFTLLRTKLYKPQVRSDWVRRPRLEKRLKQGMDRKLTLVSALAGFGKSSLVASSLSESERHATWLSLDEAATLFDNVMNLQLQPEQVATPYLRTEGWIVGLQCAALFLRGHPAYDTFWQDAGHFSSAGKVRRSCCTWNRRLTPTSGWWARAP